MSRLNANDETPVAFGGLRCDGSQFDPLASEIPLFATLLARTSERSLVTSDPGATGKFSEIPLETSENLLETS